MPKVRPFKFSGLKQYTTEQVVIQESLATYLSYRPFETRFGEKLGHELEKFLKVPCGFSRGEVKPVARNELAALLPSTACLLVIGATPTEHKIIVDLDTTLASVIIERLLGGSGGHSIIRRPLTEIEEGVLSFVILKVLAHFAADWHTGKEITLNLDRFASKLHEIQEIVDSVPGYHLVGMRVAAGKHKGYARILIPQGLVTQSFATPPSQGPVSGPELEYMRCVLASIGSGSTVARVEASTLDLDSEDIANLEVGDIVIIENHQISMTPTGIEGTVFVKIGNGVNGGLQCRLMHEGEQSRLEVIEVVVQEEPLESEMVDEEGAAPAPEDADTSRQEDNLAQTQGLLRDLEAPVVVELGRIRMNTAQVARLRGGQILRLPRGPNDPVDLVVNGKVFARGELIEVDGELGVRLLQIAGAS